MMRYLFPLAIFFGLVALLAIGLQKDPRLVPSPFIDKMAPALDLPKLDDPNSKVSLEELRGRYTLVNIWASWCVACREEHETLLELAKGHRFFLLGFNYKDKPEDAQQWLQSFGNPYDVIVTDEDGRAGINWGVYGVPETFLLDQQGIVIYKHVGPLTEDVINTHLLPLIGMSDP